MPQFERYIGIDYSGAETPDSSWKGLRVYVVETSGTPEPSLPRKCRRRRRFSKEGRNHALISLPLFHRPNSGANLTQT